MNTSAPSFAFALALLSALHLSHSTAAAQGALNPPGAPAPTMKTLDQIEPHTPISALPFTISAPGYYYLTGNLTATADGNAITVSASNVTIDLNGFTLAGGNTGTRTGIAVPTPKNTLTVRNGTLTGWTTYAINGDTEIGGRYEKLRIVSNSSSEAVRTGAKATVDGCVAYNNSSSVAPISTNVGCLVRDCVFGTNSAAGLSTASGCTVVNCAANENTGVGIITSTGSAISNCSASSNQGGGFSAGAGSTITNCSAVVNGSGIIAGDNVTITDCTASTNSVTGVQAGNGCTIRGCTVAKNGSSGLAITSRNQVTGCTFDSNNTSAIPGRCGLEILGGGNRIDSNHFTNNNYAGFTAVVSGGNLIIRNTFSGAQYIIAGGNTVGPSVDMSAGGGTISSTNPWANIMH